MIPSRTVYDMPFPTNNNCRVAVLCSPNTFWSTPGFPVQTENNCLDSRRAMGFIGRPNPVTPAKKGIQERPCFLVGNSWIYLFRGNWQVNCWDLFSQEGEEGTRIWIMCRIHSVVMSETKKGGWTIRSPWRRMHLCGQLDRDLNYGVKCGAGRRMRVW